MQNETPTPAQPGDLRATLLDIAAAANDALYCSYATPEATTAGYAEALDAIRKRLDPGTFFTPTAIATGAFLKDAMPKPDSFLANHRMWYVNLPGLYGVRFDGIERDNYPRRTYGAFCRTVEEGLEHFEVFRDNKMVGHGEFYIGHSFASKIVNVMAKALVRRSEHSIRNKQNRKAKRAAAAATEPVEPVNPPLEIPPRPGLPEDDE